jgi:transcriptional regulator with XRE-family HTH domain
MASNIDKIYKELGQRIVKERKKLGMSQERLAAESGIDRSHLGFIEQGRRRPTISTLNKLCQSLGVTLGELFKGL